MSAMPPWFSVPINRLTWDLFPATEPERSKAIIDLAIRENAKEMPYDEYRQTEHWYELRRRAKQRNGGMCCHCHKAYAVDAHHITYDRLGVEDDADVIGLCRPCHTKFHDNWIPR